MLFVSFLVVYILFNGLEIDKKNKITGAVVSEPEYESISLGKYSIKPSFNQKLDFDIFGDYEVIVNKAKQLKNSCKLAEDTEACVNNNKNIFDTDNLILTDDCETELKKAFSNFAEEVYLCANSEDNNCICKFDTLDADYDSVYIEKNKVRMIKDDEILFEDNLDADYEGSSSFKPNKEVILLKINNKLGEYNKEDLPFCKIKKDTFRFCIESNKQVYAYSEEDKQTKLRNIQYKFALNFE